jgi:Ribosomal protein L5
MSAVADTYMPRLKDQYEREIRPRLKDELELDSIMQVPRLEKITLNMGVGEAKTESKAMDSAIEELTTIAGQRAQVRRARKSIAQFKVREGMPVGARVTLRGAMMYEFLDRLVSIALPHPRLPRPQPALAGRPRQLLARHPRAAHLPGDQLRRHPAGPRLDVTITTSAETDEHALALLRASACRSRPMAKEGISNGERRRSS